MGQVRLIFENPCVAASSDEPAIAVLVRLRMPTEAMQGVCLASPGCKWKTQKLLEQHACQRIKWEVDDESIFVHMVVTLRRIMRWVSIVPDFNHTVILV